MNVELHIGYTWDLSDFPNITDHKKEKLKVVAEKFIAKQNNKGIKSGELHYEDKKGRKYWGWFEISFK